MQENLIPSITIGLGALVYSLWGYYNVYKDKGENFKWKKLFATIIPPFVVAFVAAYTNQIGLSNPGDFVMALLAGFGWAKAQNKIGLN